MCKCEHNYQICYYCGKSVNVNKPFIGSMHICVTEEERARIDYARSLMKRQLDYKIYGLSTLDKMINEIKYQQN